MTAAVNSISSPLCDVTEINKKWFERKLGKKTQSSVPPEKMHDCSRGRPRQRQGTQIITKMRVCCLCSLKQQHFCSSIWENMVSVPNPRKSFVWTFKAGIRVFLTRGPIWIKTLFSKTTTLYHNARLKLKYHELNPVFILLIIVWIHYIIDWIDYWIMN